MASAVVRGFPRREEALGRQRRRAAQRVLAGALATVAVVLTVTWGPLVAKRAMTVLGSAAAFVADSLGGFGGTGPLVRADLETVEVVVRPGDTLWAIAEAYGPPGRDVREVVDWIRTHNRVDPGALRPGMVLVVPSAEPGR